MPRRLARIASCPSPLPCLTADQSVEAAPRSSSAELRRELSHRNQLLSEAMPHESTIGEVPSILYRDVDGEHGNFIAASYRRICTSAEWQLRLKKCYTANRRIARPRERQRRELDCANSSDALLMNIFCYPGVTSRRRVCQLLGIERGARPRFGVRTHMPCADSFSDRTEVDMVLGHLLVEAKLTESDFQSAPRHLIHRYVGINEVFDAGELVVSRKGYRNYQLIRGVLAAHHYGSPFLLLHDRRRSDMTEEWYRVMRAVKGCELRSRLAILTWQELTATLPPKLQRFLQAKYGIFPSPGS